MSASLLVVGAGGFGFTVWELALQTGDWSRIEFLDDSFPEGKYKQLKLVGCLSQLPTLATEYDAVVVAIGNNRLRKELIESVEQAGGTLAILVSPLARVSEWARLGEGVAVMPGAYVGANAAIGKGCLLNPNSTADHDAVMEPFSQLGVGASIAGTGIARQGAWLRAGVSLSYSQIAEEWTIYESDVRTYRATPL